MSECIETEHNLINILESEDYSSFKYVISAKLDQKIEEQVWKEYNKFEKSINDQLFINKHKTIKE